MYFLMFGSHLEMLVYKPTKQKVHVRSTHFVIVGASLVDKRTVDTAVIRIVHVLGFGP